MAVSFGSLVLNVADLDRAARFWSGALGYAAQPDEPAFLGPASGSGPRLHLDERDRTHIDLWLDRTGSDLETEVARLVALGATRVEWTYPPDADFVVLADTEGNLFCVVA
jgi:catechol 2,3-dioxygenase-like lactoylglutathione lyase family enzyme